MIERLLEIQKLNLASKIAKDNIFNSTLPIRVKVLAKKGGMKYFLQVGARMLETRSQRELEVGAKYFAMMKGGKAGNIILSSLTPEPKVSKSPLSLDFLESKELLSKNTFKEIAEFASEQLAHSKNKEEFLQWAFVLSGLQKGVLSLNIQEEEKKHYTQIKKRKNSLEFYALFSHLGSISGLITPSTLDLSVMYPSVAKFLSENLEGMKWKGEVRIKVSNGEIEPLFFLQEQLLNLSI
ncbi:MAG TPA: hypothetical protein IAA23_01635 [Candidatus Helicobacter avistercoris]|nr:hypothetical protein [Candidatus Helicobacter avistercoris]